MSKADPVRKMYKRKFKIVNSHPNRKLSVQMLAQLSQCKSDVERRLILGLSRKGGQ